MDYTPKKMSPTKMQNAIGCYYLQIKKFSLPEITATYQISVIVFVTKKLSISDLKSRGMKPVPDSVEISVKKKIVATIPTNVQEAVPFRAFIHADEVAICCIRKHRFFTQPSKPLVEGCFPDHMTLLVISSQPSQDGIILKGESLWAHD